MGKGGVGKTSIAAALALGHAQQGERVGFASLASGPELEEVVHRGWGAPPPTLELIALNPRRIVDEVLAQLLVVPVLAHLVSGHPAYDALFRIAPGIRELAVLHRLVALSEQGYERIVLDGLATGHGTHFLETPRKSARILVGRLAERARAVDAALTDASRAEVLLATTLEEMPVREAVEVAALLRQGGFAARALVVNRAPERLFASDEALGILEKLQERSAASAIGSQVGAPWSLVRRMAMAAVHQERRAREAQPLLGELGGLGLPLVSVPVLPVDEGRLSLMAAKLREGGL